MKYKLIIFDFDGTIADTSLGIIDSHKYTLAAMGKSIPQDEMLRKVIGGNLLKTYIETFGFQEDDARKAVGIYRKRYAACKAGRLNSIYVGRTSESGHLLYRNPPRL